jgi:hypothetical protein
MIERSKSNVNVSKIVFSPHEKREFDRSLLKEAIDRVNSLSPTRN